MATLDIDAIADRIRSAFPQYTIEVDYHDDYVTNIMLSDRMRGVRAWVCIDLDTYANGRITAEYYAAPNRRLKGAYRYRDRRILRTAIGP